jgi:hypothetical protein
MRERDEQAELDGWQEEWRALGDGAALADALAERCARDGRRIRRSLAIELIAGIVSSAIVIALIVRAHGAAPVTVICGAILAFNGAWVTRFFVARRGELSPAGEGLDRFVELTRRRLASDRALARFASRANLVIACLLVPALTWLLADRWERVRLRPIPVALAVAFAILIHVGALLWTRRKQRGLVEEEARFEALIARGKLA